MRVLVVDDEPAVREVLARILKVEGSRSPWPATGGRLSAPRPRRVPTRFCWMS